VIITSIFRQFLTAAKSVIYFTDVRPSVDHALSLHV